MDFCWGNDAPQKLESHIAASHSRQPLVKGERLVRHEVNAVIVSIMWPFLVQRFSLHMYSFINGTHWLLIFLINLQ